MAIPDFVIDSELFSLFNPTNNNILDRIKHQLDNEFVYNDDEETVKEAKCFHEVLKNMKKYKCAISRNESIRNDYMKLIKNCDGIVKKKFIRMIATKSYWNHNNEMLTSNQKEIFKETSLEEKTHYIDAARQCKDYQVIVSTRKYADKYLENRKELSVLEVDCESICEFKNSLEEFIAKQQLETVDSSNEERKKSDFVIDSEIFLMITPTDDGTIIEEAEYFLEILKKIEGSKFKISRNESIRQDYLRVIDDCDDRRIKKKFYKLMSTKSCWNHNNEMFTNNHKEMFTGTPLEGKTHYIDAARQCNDYRVIVSTRERTEEYFTQYGKLLEFEVNCESICEFKNTLDRALLEGIMQMMEMDKSNQKEIKEILRILQKIETEFDNEETLFKKLTDIISLNIPLIPISLDLGKIVKLYRQESKKWIF
jgi:hypothetical protein